MLAELKTQHREILRLKLAGHKPVEIAARTETKLSTVYQILRDPLAKSFLAGLNDRADSQVLATKQELARLQLPAVKTYEELLESPATPATVLRQAAKDILDFNGHKPVEKRLNANATLTSQDISDLKQRMLLAQEAEE